MPRPLKLALLLLPILALAAQAQTTQGLDASVRSDMSPDEVFAMTAASSDLFEIESSKAALGKAKRVDVKAFAQHMIEDHQATSEKLKAAAAADGLDPVSAPDSKHAEMIKAGQQSKAGDYDEVYLNLQETAHEEAIALFEDYAESGAGQNLKAFAAETLPALRQHLSMIEDLDTK